MGGAKRQIYFGLLGGFLFSSIFITLVLVWAYSGSKGYCDYIAFTLQNPCTLLQFIVHNFYQGGIVYFFVFIAAAFMSEFFQRSSLINRILITMAIFLASFYIADVLHYAWYLQGSTPIDIGGFTRANLVWLLESGLFSGLSYCVWRLLILRPLDRKILTSQN